ncbi:MAG: uL14 family ribosomal protein [Candidatus Aenigmarchaeota archaeon]|nr:uL14 family ribosomal protein [Candidatus Aenigmarchaeota archaeon]MCK5321839.1 uL14 family ribosomal protein [Candidatus Aenigmarchaeota archaeon]
MKAMSTHPTKAIMIGSNLKCIDNSGAKQLEVIAVPKIKGTRRRIPSGGVGSIIICTVKKGKPDIKHKVERAVITTQRKEYQRINGLRVKYSENTAVLINEKNEPKGNEIKGIVAKEAVERFPQIGKIAAMII